MKNKMIMMFALCCFIFVQSVEASDIGMEITLAKDHYNYSEKIEPVITLRNNENKNLTINFYEEFKHLKGEIAPYFYSEIITLPAKKNIILSKIYLFIFDYYPEGEYEVYAEARDEENTLLASATRGFHVHTPKNIDLNLLTCKEESCFTPSKIFHPNENVYLDFQSSITDLKISGLLTDPSNKQKNISVPGSVKVSQIGTYSITITASKAGHKKVVKETKFAVIEHEADIKSVSACNANGVCDNNENHQNCPQDCPSGSKDDYCDSIKDKICDPDCIQDGDMDCMPETANWIYIIFPIIIIMILFTLIHKLKRKKKHGPMN